jgi:hypothetical protein
MVYCGIGSINTPKPIIDLMTEIGMYFGKHDLSLRTRGTTEADKAFASGSKIVQILDDVDLLLGPERLSPTRLLICWSEDEDGPISNILQKAMDINRNSTIDYVIPLINLRFESNRVAITNVLKGTNPVGFISYSQSILMKYYSKGLFNTGDLGGGL